MEDLASQLGYWANRITGTRGFAWLVNVGALILLTSGLAQWTWALTRPSAPAPKVSVHAPKTSPEQSVNLDRLLTIELFGHSPESNANDKDVPVSTLNLILMGVVAAGGESLALISVDGREQLPFAIGEEIAHGAVLDSVHPDRVIILRQGVRESLMLQDLSPSIPLSSITPPGTSTTASISGVTKLESNVYRLNRTMLQSQLGSPTLLSQALIVPHADGGFQVRNLAPGSLYAKAGLKTGDVIKKVNGQSINNLDDAMRVYREMGGIDRLVAVNVDIDRQGSSRRIQYQLR